MSNIDLLTNLAYPIRSCRKLLRFLQTENGLTEQRLFPPLCSLPGACHMTVQPPMANLGSPRCALVAQQTPPWLSLPLLLLLLLTQVQAEIRVPSQTQDLSGGGRNVKRTKRHTAPLLLDPTPHSQPLPLRRQTQEREGRSSWTGIMTSSSWTGPRSVMCRAACTTFESRQYSGQTGSTRCE